MAKKDLNMISLVGVGIGGIIGAGFFLGCGLAVREAGPSVILAFILGGLIMTQVLGAIISIHVNRLAPGSFRVYVEQILGEYPGFLIGWTIFTSGILTMVAEALAMAVFIRYWFPGLHLPVLATLFLLIVIAFNSLGIGAFGKIESSMAALKVLTLVIFIALGGYSLLTSPGVIQNPLFGFKAFFPHGLRGLLQSMLIVIFCFAGISALALASSEAQNPRRTIPKACTYMSVGTILLYTLSMLVLVFIVPWGQIYTTRSPFVQAFDTLHIKWAAYGINIIILIAAFSVITATYFTATQMIVSLSRSSKAPGFLSRVSKHGLYYYAWAAVGVAVLVLAAVSFVLPQNLFHYLISASSYFTFLNWTVNLITYLVWSNQRKPNETFRSRLILGRPGAVATIAVIALLVVFSLQVTEFRLGFYAAGSVILVVSLGYVMFVRGRRKPSEDRLSDASLEPQPALKKLPEDK